ncbi:Txe/YoeB family addiction module toxin [Janthinobacterium sp. PC23-8]|uniref:Txe/YoeB family addiction module toxin n=1 Tax=Janthinobacterium sp. PC23-8 TaxID=2012679 RepID=UPI000B9666F1|nr:Txe/YoeB family addiction module toxin [Janthinobacterium sp. PC23-8]OYO30211.1 Txe/YoeB family addiction module toxin [Janthinobacterium sp. PC23-8]
MKNQKSSNKEQAKQSSVVFTDVGWEDYQHWQKEDTKQRLKINDLIDACVVDPFKGIGKPEPLKGNLTGLWSRRIDREHRLVYLVESGVIYVVGCRYHY